MLKKDETISTIGADQALQDWAACWTTHDIPRLLALFTDDCIYEDVTLGIANHGETALEAFARGFIGAFPDLAVDLRSRFDAGAWAGVEWSMSGTHQGDLPGMPATNKRFTLRGASIFEIRADKIRRCSDYWDLVTFLKQLGLPVPA